MNTNTRSQFTAPEDGEPEDRGSGTRTSAASADRDLYTAIRMRAVAEGRPVRDIVVEALQRWLDSAEDLEDSMVAEQRRGEEDLTWEEVLAAFPELRDDAA